LESNLSTSLVINVFSCLYSSHEFCEEAIWMTSSSPAVACLDYAPHKGVGEVAVRARRSCKSFWLRVVLQVTNQVFDSHLKQHKYFFVVLFTVPMRLVLETCRYSITGLLRGRNWHEGGENYRMRSFTMCTLHQIDYNDQITRVWMGGVRSTLRGVKNA
jgi:hypothetical protein